MNRKITKKNATKIITWPIETSSSSSVLAWLITDLPGDVGAPCDMRRGKRTQGKGD